MDGCDEANVITEDLIRECIKALNKAEPGQTIEPVVSLRETPSLIASFQRIKRIDNLRGLDSLTRLQLDNNSISKIENLGHLTNLTWLDLSFNNLTKIEGLDSLTKLTDLSLFNNKIDRIEGLDSLANLNVLSLGNNSLKNLDSVLYLRRLRNLRLLNLEGNPFSKDPEYKNYVLAHVKDLKYLDYRTVEAAAVTAAREQYQDELIEIEEKEEAELQREKDGAEKAAEVAHLKEANLTGIGTLFEDMIAEDPEHAKLKKVQGLLDSLSEFRDKCAALTEDFRTAILEQHKKVDDERQLWQDAVKGATADKNAEARALVSAFESMRKKALQAVKEDPGSSEEALRGPREANERLREKLLELEMHTVDILEDLWTEFDKAYVEIMDANKLQYTAFFGAIRTLENTFFEAVGSQAAIYLEKFAGGAYEDAEEEIKQILQDKDALMNSLQASHDAHTTKIDQLEDARLQQALRAYQEMTASNRKWEIQRNRERISEIWNLFDRNKADLEAVLEDDE